MTYKDYLRAVGRQPLPANLRTEKSPGDRVMTIVRNSNSIVTAK